MPLYRAREELIEKGYIRYEKGKGREAGTYTMRFCVTVCVTVCVPIWEH